MRQAATRINAAARGHLQRRRMRSRFYVACLRASQEGQEA